MIAIDDQDEHLTTYVTDDPDPDAGGACHEYEVQDEDGGGWLEVSFQHGPIGDAGVNGVQHRQLLAIAQDRLQAFQGGPFASDLNAETLAHVTAAIESDAKRTRKRTGDGVEGTNEKAPSVEG